ncbi:MAG: serine hydrolase domain-containing protein [Cytophagaceae bacterium]
MAKRKNKRGKAFLVVILFLVLLNLLLLVFEKGYIYRALWYNFAEIDDYTIFDNRMITASPEPQPWPVSEKFNQIPLTQDLKQQLERLKSVAFLVIKNDSIIHEEYWESYGPDSFSNSFSMAKSYVGAMVGIALKEGKIKSLDQPVGDFLPYYNEGKRKNITIRHLLTMSSGLDWNEAYANPFSITTEAYYGTDLNRTIQRLEVEEEPGVYYNYRSGDTQILAAVLKEATGKTLSEYMQENIWHPTGSENEAKWSLDEEGGMEKAYCCLNSNARDFARIAKLFMQKGNWNGNQLIDSAYVEKSLRAANLEDPNMPGEQINYYGFQWWLIPDYKKLGDVFYARGILGQYVIAVPSEDLIIVRLGHKRGNPVGKHYDDVYLMIDEVCEIF